MKQSATLLTFATVSLFGAPAAMADDLVIPLTKDTVVEKVETTYQCGSDKVEAVYFNAGDISLVRLGLKSGVTVAANVISGSGARYESGVYVWWSKGDEADLYDVMADPEMKQPTHCVDVKKS